MNQCTFLNEGGRKKKKTEDADTQHGCFTLIMHPSSETEVSTNNCCPNYMPYTIFILI